MNEQELFEKWVRETYGSAINLDATYGIYGDPFVMTLYVGWRAGRENMKKAIIWMTPMDNIYAGIGSRSTPDSILTLMTDLGRCYAEAGWTLRSGRAEGADSAFERGARQVEIVHVDLFTVDDVHTLDRDHWAIQTVYEYHPAPHRLSEYAMKLHARNAMIVLGARGDKPVDFIVCWTPDAKITGGTGQALRIAEAHDIHVVNLAEMEMESATRDWVGEDRNEI